MLTPATGQLRNGGLFQGTLKAPDAEGTQDLPSGTLSPISCTLAVLLRPSRGGSKQLSNSLHEGGGGWHLACTGHCCWVTETMNANKYNVLIKEKAKGPWAWSIFLLGAKRFTRSLSSEQIPKVTVGFAEGGDGKVGVAVTVVRAKAQGVSIHAGVCMRAC